MRLEDIYIPMRVVVAHPTEEHKAHENRVGVVMAFWAGTIGVEFDASKPLVWFDPEELEPAEVPARST